jgi:LysR family transcriptional regulator, nitrogen assimilation regulatory protein
MRMDGGGAMDIRQLEYFLHVASTLNITHASMRAHVSQPALSRQIRLLEQELGMKLFKRKVRGVELTETGLRLLERTRGLLADVGQLKSEIMSRANEPTGVVRIAASNSLSHILTARVVANYRARYPAVSVCVSENTSMIVRQAIATNAADLAVLSDRESFAGLTKAPLLAEQLLLIGPREAGLKLSQSVEPSVLTDLDLILTPFPNGLRRVVDAILVRTGKVSTTKMEVDTNSLMIHMAQLGAGYAVLPYSGVHEALRRGEVSAAPINGTRWGWVVATSRERALTTAAQKLAELIFAETRLLLDGGLWATAHAGPQADTGRF